MVVANGAKLRNAGADPSTLHLKGRFVGLQPEWPCRRKEVTTEHIAGLAVVATDAVRGSQRNERRRLARGPYRRAAARSARPPGPIGQQETRG